MRFFRKLITWFLRGLLLIAPVFATFYALWFVFSFLDSHATDLTELVLGERVRGIGLLAVFLLITVIGVLGSTVFLQPLLVLFEDILERTPLVKDIYGSLKDLFNAFIGNKAKFKKPVTVEMGKNTGVFRVGFMTQEDLSEINIKDKVAVYLPLSYSFAGILVLVNREQVLPMEGVSASEAMKFILSGGITELED
jgi:uncharacterized membrane protein